MNYFQHYAQTLHNNGYSVIPIKPQEKIPSISNWQNCKDISQQTLTNWLSSYSDCGIGVLTHDNPAIDVDIRDQNIADEVQKQIALLLDDGFTLIRMGQTPKFLIPCQLEGTPFSKISGRKFFSADGNKHQIEVLGKGQQFVAYGWHKEAQTEYTWISKQSLLDVKRIELPRLSATKAQQIMNVIESYFPSEWALKAEGSKFVHSDNLIVELSKPSSNLSQEAQYKLSKYQFWLKNIPAMLSHDEWKGVLMALHKEGNGHPDFYYLARTWSMTAGEVTGGFDEQAQKALPPDYRLSSIWKSFKNNLPNSKDEAYIHRLFNQYCEQAAISDFVPIMATSKMIESTRLEVMSFDADRLLPAKLATFVKDAAKRMNCPSDFIGVSIIPILTSIIGSQIMINPKRKDSDYKIYPTAWAMLIAEPSSMKSPAMQLVIKPLEKAQLALEKDFKAKLAQHKQLEEFRQSMIKDQKEDVKKLLKISPDKQDGTQKGIAQLRNIKEEESPKERHIVANDVSIEILQIMMANNDAEKPYSGILFYRDELSSHLETLSREDRSNERGFFMQCFNGYGQWRTNRISRDKVVVPNTNLSILGTIQPAKIAKHVKDLLEGVSNDGLFQRYQFAVYPQKMPRKWVDEPVNEEALHDYQAVINQLLSMNFLDNGEPRVVKFDEQAQNLYQQFCYQLYESINHNGNHSVYKSHLGKMDKTIATLALLFELVDNPNKIHPTISLTSMQFAYNWFDYLKSHAQAIYAIANNVSEEAAELILARKDKLPEVFTVRDITRKRWTGLSDKRVVANSLCELETTGHVSSFTSGFGRGLTTKYQWTKVG